MFRKILLNITQKQKIHHANRLSKYIFFLTNISADSEKIKNKILNSISGSKVMIFDIRSKK